MDIWPIIYRWKALEVRFQRFYAYINVVLLSIVMYNRLNIYQNLAQNVCIMNIVYSLAAFLSQTYLAEIKSPS